MEFAIFAIICFISSVVFIIIGIDMIKSEKFIKSNHTKKSDENALNKEEIVNYKVEKEKGRICLLDEHGKMISCEETAYLNDYENENYVLFHPEDKKHYHVFLACYKNWEYKEKFDYWRCITIQEAKEKGLTLCEKCNENLCSKEEKLEKILKNKKCKFITLMGSTPKDIQEVLTWVYLEKIYLAKVFFEYDYEKDRYLVKDHYGQLLGFIKETILEKNGIDNLEQLPAYISKVYSTDISDKWCCEIVIILE